MTNLWALDKSCRTRTQLPRNKFMEIGFIINPLLNLDMDFAAHYSLIELLDAIKVYWQHKMEQTR